MEDLVKRVKTSMMGMFSTIYPVDAPPSDISMLADWFMYHNGQLVDFSMAQLGYRAGIALAFFKAHHPNIDVDTIAKGILLDVQGDPVSIEDLILGI